MTKTKLETFKANLDYWKEELERADNIERLEHCKKEVARYQKKVDNPEHYAGY